MFQTASKSNKWMLRKRRISTGSEANFSVSPSPHKWRKKLSRNLFKCISLIQDEAWLSHFWLQILTEKCNYVIIMESCHSFYWMHSFARHQRKMGLVPVCWIEMLSLVTLSFSFHCLCLSKCCCLQYVIVYLSEFYYSIEYKVVLTKANFHLNTEFADDRQRLNSTLTAHNSSE